MKFTIIFILLIGCGSRDHGRSDAIEESQSLINKLDEAPEVVNGRLSLERFTQDSIELKGTWNFYPRLFLSSKPEIAAEATQINVPGGWKTQGPGSQDSYGTYQVKIRTSESEQTFYIKISELPSSWELWSNKTFAGRNGKIGTSKESSLPGRGTKIIPVKTDREGNLEIWLQISSFYHVEGGIWKAPTLQSHVGIIDSIRDDMGLDGILIGSLFIMGIYHIVLFALRPQNKSPLYFGIFCLLFTLRKLNTSEGSFLVRWFSNIDTEWWKKFEYLSMAIGAPLFLSFAKSTFSSINVRGMRVFWGIASLPIAVILFTPQKIYGAMLTPIHVLIAASTTYTFYILVMANIKKEPGAPAALGGFLFFATTVIHDILIAMKILDGSFLIAVGLVCFIFAQASNLATRFSNAFNEVESNQKTISTLNIQLQDHIENLDRKVAEKTRDIRSILDSMGQGIFTISKENIVFDDNYSPFLEEMIQEKGLANKSVLEVLFSRSNIDENTKDQIKSVIQSSIGEDILAFTANKHHLIDEFTRSDLKGHECIYEIDWNPIVDESSEITLKILVTLRDVTNLRQLQTEAAEANKEMSYIREIIGVDAKKFHNFLDSCRVGLGRNLSLLDSSDKINPDVINYLFRDLHTIKGTARSFHLNQLADVTHKVEMFFAQVRSDLSIWDPNIAFQKLREVFEEVEHYLKVNDVKLGRQIQKSENIEVSQDEIINGLNKLAMLDGSSLKKSESNTLKYLHSMLSNLVSLSVEEILNDQFKALESISKELGKEKPIIEVQDNQIRFSSDIVPVLEDCFIHLLRNAIDHGIETPEERQQLGKPKYGKISILVREEADHVQFRFWDDGRGVNMSEVRASAISRGIINEDYPDDPQKVLEIIFKPGFSTKDKVSMISGHGIGLDAVQGFISANGGQISVEVLPRDDKNELWVTFATIIKLPKKFMISAKLKFGAA